MKVSPARLPHARVDLKRPIDFMFDGRSYRGFVGDTLASALLANGVAVVGRSFKFHRPRGLMSAGIEECNALVQLEEGAWTEPSARATLVPLYPGLRARGQNAWPNVRQDLFGVLNLARRALPASFYYKTFMWPSWHVWERVVRSVAGLGRAPAQDDPQAYLQQNLHMDVLVVGAGRAGLQAALEASADPGCRVVVADNQEEHGGRLLASPVEDDRSWMQETLAALGARANVTLLPRTTVNGYYDHNTLAGLERMTTRFGPQAPATQPRERFWRLFAKRVVLATGALERPLVFPHNDRPGIMLASAVAEYAHRYGVVAGEELVFYVNNDSGWRTAIELARHGVPVAHIVDIRGQVDESLAVDAARTGIVQHLGWVIVATHGRPSIKGVQLARLEQDGNALAAGRKTLSCDLLAMAGGWTPTLHLYSQAGGRLRWQDEDACHLPDSCPQAVTVVGRAAGDFRGSLGIRSQWLTPEVDPANQWVDFQYDVTAADIQLAVRENFISVEHVKRYTTNGMSLDQGKTSNVNGLGILAEARGQPIPEVGTTRFRPPFHPVTFGAFAGVELAELYQPFRQLPAHAAQLASNAKLEDYGGWQRPAYYPRAGEDEAAAIMREVRAVRERVGLLDYSPLGKLEVRGPDAREFLHRVYVNNLRTLKVGAARYGLMLNEGGIVIDDGVAVCLTEDHFLLHTTSGGASHIHQHLEEWLQCEWTNLRVLVSNVTSAWATFMLTGPRARAVLGRLDCDIELSSEAFPHMAFRRGTLANVSCRILRASFTGEVSFEVSVPAGYGRSLWEALMDAGDDQGIVPFGIESLMVLRTEKGFLHVGSDTDGNTMPQDLGFERIIERKVDDFVGRRSLVLPVGREPGRLQFTGIEPLESAARFELGAHVLNDTGDASAGYVTSTCFSPSLGRAVALGIVADARTREGATVEVIYNGQRTPARLVRPGAYDPKGERLNV